MLGQRGIKPEELPPSEDIKKLERRVESQENDNIRIEDMMLLNHRGYNRAIKQYSS